MKDTQTKPVSPTPKTKPGLNKKANKMPAKKIKEPKPSAPKVPSKGTKKNQNSLLDKKPKTMKEDSKDAPKRKRGRPRNDDKPPTTKKQQQTTKELKGSIIKTEIIKRKRKPPQNGSLKNPSCPPSKKLKISDISLNMNGNAKTSPSVVYNNKSSHNTTVTNNCSNGGTSVVGLGNKKSAECPTSTSDKPTSTAVSTTKTVTFHPNTKSEVLNGNGSAKPFKSQASKNVVKSILKNDAVHQQQPIKEAKKTNNLFNNQNPSKLHPQRMASLDALARMHVICIPDRKPVDHHHHSKASTVVSVSEPFTKSMTHQCHERIQFDLKKESNKDSKGNLVHKQQINYVKEKQQVFVSHSVEQSSKTVVDHQHQEKTKKSSTKLTTSAKANNSNNQNATKSPAAKVKGEKSRTNNKAKDQDQQKSAKSSPQIKAAAKGAKKKDSNNKLVAANKGGGGKKTTKKVEQQTKSEVKVKETIRMHKTCTYQSVTTTNSTVVPVSSHVGLTTNYSKTKKTVVTDQQECKNNNNKMNFSSSSSSGSVNSFCVTSSESPCSHHSDYYKFHHAHHSTPPLIPFAHVQACTLGHRTTSDSSPSSAPHCDGGNFAVHRFGHHQQAVIYSPSTECSSCCCSNSIVQNLHDSCLLRKSIVYPHPPSGFSTEALSPAFPPSCCHLSPYHRPSPPCEPSPLDLSLASSSSTTSSVETTPHPLCCAGEVLLVRSTPCCRGVVPPKREKSPPKLLLQNKKQFAHGWSWKGTPREKMICLTNDSTPCPRMCYPSVQHEEGDVINEKDCVLLRSGPKDTDLPYVAKVAAFWENPDDGEMMMSLLWYYRPEHTDQGRKPGQMEDEVFASKHKDVNSIACIEDKCYVLTYNEYCRYRASLTMDEDAFSIASRLVPEPSEGYPRKSRLPVDPVSSDIVFVCRYVYDFRQKRTLKNPT